MKVREIIQIKGEVLYKASPDQTIASAIAQMTEHDAGSLIVMSEDRIAGMLTFREVLKVLAKNANAMQMTIGEIMIQDPITVPPEMDANDLRRLMIDKHVRYLPVIEDGKLLNVISLLDIAKAVLEEQGFENRMLKNYIKHWPEGGDPSNV